MERSRCTWISVEVSRRWQYKERKVNYDLSYNT